MRALLDINVLIALMDEKHEFHERAHVWWQTHADEGWASCPLTENGFIRIVSQISSRLETKITPGVLAEQLAAFRRGTDHQFWPDDISITDVSQFWFDRLCSPRQVTDIYLLGLAAKHGGSFATFDRAVPLNAVLAARPEHLVVL
jgi:toxin-antitoxin system PIN domain toxin